MVFNKKCRMISFRLTADEYTDALNRCAQNGYRSVSTLARTATLSAAPSSEIKESQEIRVIAEMRAKMSEMRTNLNLILTMFAGKIEPDRFQECHDDLAVTTTTN